MQFQEHRGSLVVLAAFADFEAMQEGDDSGGVGHAAESNGGEDGSRARGVARFFADLRQPQIEADGLSSPGAQQTPAMRRPWSGPGVFPWNARLKLEDDRRGRFVVAAH